MKFDSMIFIPVKRAQHYSYWPDSGMDEPIVDLEIDHLTIDTGVNDGMVTLAASTRKSREDAYGQEYDISPTGARLLGAQLIAAADEVDRDGGAPRPRPRSL